MASFAFFYLRNLRILSFSSMPLILQVILFAIVLGAIIFIVLRRDLSPWWLFGTVMGIFAFFYLWSPLWRVYTAHSFMHMSIVYQILEGRWPLENPLFAGRPLNYMWTHHLMIAALAKLGISPWMGFIWLGLAVYIGTILTTWRLGWEMFGERKTAVLGVILSLFGVTFVRDQGLITNFLKGRFPYLGLDVRGIPLVAKFHSQNSTQLGELTLVLYWLALFRIFSQERPGKGALVLAAGSLVATGWLYPLLWIPGVASTVVIGGVWLLLKRREGLRKTLTLAAIAGFSVLATVPYVQVISGSRAPEASAHLELLPEQWLKNAYNLGAPLLLPLLILWLMRGKLQEAFRNRSVQAVMLGSMTVTGMALYMVLAIPTDAEYKFRMVTLFGIGMASSVIYRDILDRRPKLTFLLLALCMMPYARIVIIKTWENPWVVADLYKVDGIYLRHQDPNQDALYTWLREHTPSDAVIVDLHMTVPIFAQRSLFCGMDDRWNMNPPRNTTDGWGYRATIHLQYNFGYHSDDIQARRETVYHLLQEPCSDQAKKYRLFLESVVGKREVDFIVRDPGQYAIAAACSHFQRVFRRGDLSVFRYLPL